MKLVLCIVTTFFLFITFKVSGQNSQEFNLTNIVGFWYTDSSSQAIVEKEIPSDRDFSFDKPISELIKEGLHSRQYIFLDNGAFTAIGVIGERQSVVTGKWNIINKEQINIEVYGINTQYSVRGYGIDKIVLTPLRERRGEIHELYFIKQKEK